MTIDSLTIRKPWDMHVHFRDGERLQSVADLTAQHFAGGIIMPNLKPPVRTVQDAQQYRERILRALGEQAEEFLPMMTLYLTGETTTSDIEEAAKSDFVYGVKYYPSGQTTNSEFGLSSLLAAEKQLRAMEDCELPLLAHGETVQHGMDIFYKERHFYRRGSEIEQILKKHRYLYFVAEHITTEDAVNFVGRFSVRKRVFATITPQHLLFTRNNLLEGGIKPHFFCLPILKKEKDRRALAHAATSGDPSFFLGTDSAPHGIHDKESSCGCAGCFTAPHAMLLYATLFESMDALDKLEGFASLFGPRFYGLQPSEQTITLVRNETKVPEQYPFVEGNPVVPLMAGQSLPWAYG